MASRKSFRVPMIGDPGVVPEKSEHETLPADIDLDALTDGELLAWALRVGINATEVCGMKTCAEHRVMIEIIRSPNKSYQYGFDILYCNMCFTWFREKRPM